MSRAIAARQDGAQNRLSRVEEIATLQVCKYWGCRAEDLGLGDDGATQNGGRDGREVGEGGEDNIERRAQPLGADHVHINVKGSHLVGEGEGANG